MRVVALTQSLSSMWSCAVCFVWRRVVVWVCITKFHRVRRFADWRELEGVCTIGCGESDEGLLLRRIEKYVGLDSD